MKKWVSAVLAAALLAAGLSGCASSPGGPAASAPATSSAALRSRLTGLPLPDNTPQDQRPVAVMCSGDPDAYPLRGLSAAGLVYEMETEGGFTAYMGVYENMDAVPVTGPVFSGRDSFVQMMFPLDALFVHIGESTQAARLLEMYKYENKDLNGISLKGVTEADEKRFGKQYLPEHSYFTSGALLQKAVEQYHLASRLSDTQPSPCFPFMPTGQKRSLEGGEAAKVQVQFSPSTTTRFVYENGRYVKSAAGKTQTDENNASPLAFDNLFILFTTVDTYPDGVLSRVEMRFGGVGWYCSGGRFEKIRWLKGDPERPLRIVSPDGRETPVQVNPGTSYVAVVSLNSFEGFRTLKAEEPFPAASSSSVVSTTLPVVSR